MPPEAADGKGVNLSLVKTSEPVDLTPDVIGGSIKSGGWTLHVDAAARLVWPVYPYNPYQSALEKSLDHAVGALSVPLWLKSVPGHYVRPHEHQIDFVLEAN